MKAKKIKIENLEIQSFVTSFDKSEEYPSTWETGTICLSTEPTCSTFSTCAGC